MQLRDYQNDVINNIRKSLGEGNKAIVAVLGCGGGKSLIAGTIAASANSRGNRVLFIVHREELLKQMRNTFALCGTDPDLTEMGMVQTVSRRLDNMLPPAVIITDEAHHSTANTYRKIYSMFPNAVLIGFTATPIRLNKGGLGEVYQDIIKSVSTKWLIENHYLAPYKYYSVPLADTSELHIRAGEFKAEEVSKLMRHREIYGKTVSQWEKLAKGKKTIVYCSSVEAAKETALQFIGAGYEAASLDGSTGPMQRAEIVDAFRAGTITVLCNCELFGEGLDVPDCECTVLLRPTMSLTLYIQQSMRSMRYSPGKTAIIIDHVGNVHRHGLPDDDREWSLEPKQKQETIIKIRECKNCFAVFPPTKDRCPYCGTPVTHEKRCEKNVVKDIDLVEIQRQEEIRNTKLSDAELTDWDEVREFQKLHKYNFNWCFHYCLKHKIPVPLNYNPMMRKLGIIR